MMAIHRDYLNAIILHGQLGKPEWNFKLENMTNKIRDYAFNNDFTQLSTIQYFCI